VLKRIPFPLGKRYFVKTLLIYPYLLNLLYHLILAPKPLNRAKTFKGKIRPLNPFLNRFNNLKNPVPITLSFLTNPIPRGK